jgi:putative restriction endonuclease
MRFFVGITDRKWFEHLSALENLDELNFWQPSGNVQFRALQIGEPFLFKLHSPENFVVGGGFFSHSSIMPVSLAWQAFETKNGAESEDEMRRRIEKYRRMSTETREDYKIGCILLASPFFFRREDWIPVSGWAQSIVRGKGYDSSVDGKEIWDRVRSILSVEEATAKAFGENAKRYGEPQLILPRLGQGSFRLMVTDLYKCRCAFTGSPVLHVLDAAHIRPYGRGGNHQPQNGILLRQDLHTLFDRGYVTVTPDFRIEVSRRIKEEFNNGREYYALHGNTVNVPQQESFRPDRSLLLWHADNIYES